jgi:hypothetical protein
MGTKPFATRYKAEKLRQIVEQQVKRLAKRQEDSKLGLEHDGPTLDWLAGIGSDPVFGARPLKRADPAGTENANRCGDPGGQASCRSHHRRGLCARETGPSCSTRSAKPGRRNRGCRPWSVSGCRQSVCEGGVLMQAAGRCFVALMQTSAGSHPP